MSEEFAGTVFTRLFRPQHVLCLARPRPGAPRPDGGVPAVLVIPRGGRLRAPRLMTLDPRPEGAAPPTPKHPGAGASAFANVVTGTHVVARHDATVHRTSADVLVTRPPKPPAGLAPPVVRLRRALARHPECEVAIEPAGTECLAALRNGPTLRTAVARGASPPWPEMCGSFLHAWTSAGLTADDLADAVVIAGRLPPAENGRADLLEVAGRIEFTPPTTATTHQAAS
ncbi:MULTISPECIES: hypothetical protein [Actinomadura]|uniref:Uncharacterized protein n=1 Tax=Actinomadura yumaensis TaxID=111807 RepID=A0ABW2CW06_9ACTN|nr:hypothetical protein [Actinomadura sp. J1-007]MWK39427.1 hypothetical protein [Actinomadura sp. J1-007]